MSNRVSNQSIIENLEIVYYEILYRGAQLEHCNIFWKTRDFCCQKKLTNNFILLVEAHKMVWQSFAIPANLYLKKNFEMQEINVSNLILIQSKQNQCFCDGGRCFYRAKNERNNKRIMKLGVDQSSNAIAIQTNANISAQNNQISLICLTVSPIYNVNNAFICLKKQPFCRQSIMKEQIGHKPATYLFVNQATQLIVLLRLAQFVLSFSLISNSFHPFFAVEVPKFLNPQYIKFLIQMQSTINSQQNSAGMRSNLYGQTYLAKSHPYPQNWVKDQHFDYNPFSHCRQYWAFPNQYHFGHPYFNSHLNYWNHQNQAYQRPTPFPNPHGHLEGYIPKADQSIVKLEPEKEGQVEHTSQPAPSKRKYKINRKSRKNNASYYWSADQNRRYADFLSVNARLFSLSLSQKKNLRVNVMMSKKVKTRTPQQCHSHHQKMMKKYTSLENIILMMKRECSQIGEEMSEQEIQSSAQVQDQVDKDHINQQSPL